MCDNFVTFLPCGICASGTDQRLNGVRIKGRRETVTLIDMEKGRKVRGNDYTTLGMWLFLCFGEGGGGGGGCCSCSLCVINFVWESSKKWS
jgi:hypothetical protein